MNIRTVGLASSIVLLTGACVAAEVSAPGAGEPSWAWAIPIVNLFGILITAIIALAMFKAHLTIQRAQIDELITIVKGLSEEVAKHEKRLDKIETTCEFRHVVEHFKKD